MRTWILTLAFLFCTLAAAGAVQAQEEEGFGGGGSYDSGFGLGVEAMLAGPAGPAFVYQASNFHVDAILAFDTGLDENFFTQDDEIEVGGRFFYEIHSGEISDFSIGGGLGIEDDDDGGDDDLDIHLEGAAQIRAFVVPNVALHASMGLALEFDDDGGDGDDVEIGLLGQLVGGFGVTYFFF